MKISEADILIVPGLGNSGAGHWQRRWAERITNARFVEQSEWDAPDAMEWVRTLRQAVEQASRPVVLVGHSLGVSAIVAAAPSLSPAHVRGAFLVSPPDLENEAVPDAARVFAPLSRDPLPFPSLLVASASDELSSLASAEDWAAAWRSEFHSAGDAGHINTASGHGPWPEGLLMFTRLMQRLRP